MTFDPLSPFSAYVLNEWSLTFLYVTCKQSYKLSRKFRIKTEGVKASSLWIYDYNIIITCTYIVSNVYEQKFTVNSIRTK